MHPSRKKQSSGTEEEEEEWVRYASARAAAKELGLDSGNISKCCHGKYKQTGGYEFRFDTEAAAPELLEGEEWRDVVFE